MRRRRLALQAPTVKVVFLDMKKGYSPLVEGAVVRAMSALLGVREKPSECISQLAKAQVDLGSHELNADILRYLKARLAHLNDLDGYTRCALIALIFSAMEDGGDTADLAAIVASFNGKPRLFTALQTLSLCAWVNGYWRQSRFDDGARAFAWFADLADRDPTPRWNWHLCVLAAGLCNDERQHELARRFAMHALRLAWSLEDPALIQRAQYEHANALSLTMQGQLGADVFAELRAAVLAGRSPLDQVTQVNTLVGSARVFMHSGRLLEAERALAAATERERELNTNGTYLLVAAQVRMAHLKKQTLVRDSKLEELHWMQSRWPSRLGEQARSHVCFYIANSNSSYHAMDGSLELLPEAVSRSLSAITQRCRVSLKRLERRGQPMRAVALS